MRRSGHTWYRSDLKPRARRLRRDSTPAERKLWYEFLSSHQESDHGRRYDEMRTAALALDEIRIIRFTNADVMTRFEAVCECIGEALQAFADANKR